MCGIAGLFTLDRIDPALLRRMGDAIAHRGPDDQGIWSDESAGIGFSHRRLSILDLSAEGHQPMHSANGRFVICFNGEIYNHAEIRTELEQAGLTPETGWRGHSDTEILLQAFVAWGVEVAISRTVGMFALALWDRQERLLHLARDRFGEKPLFYGWAGRDLVFGSELKALRTHPKFEPTIDRAALKAFVARTYIPAPLSIYRGIFKLLPGTILTVSPAALEQPGSGPAEEGRAGPVQLRRYWNYRDVVREGLANPIEDEAEAIELLERALSQSIGGQSFADVPVGAFLSGGIDSSTIVALYQKYSAQPVRTYSIGFDEAGFNEAEHAKAVAAQLGTIHHEYYVTVAEARDAIPMLPTMFDEPFADSSQIPTLLISRFARHDVKVALTGDGGDELFGGYNRHVMAPRLWGQLRRVPLALRSIAAGPLSRISPDAWERMARLVHGSSGPFVGARIQKGLRIAQSASTFDDIYLSFLDEWGPGENPVLSADVQAGFDLDVGDSASDTERMMYCDAVSYLPDDILAKVDRASMAVGLETRVPFLDHRVAALAARIPETMKIRSGQGKHVLRQLLYREAPRHLFERPKAGFAIPVGQWIKGPLRPWAEELLDPRHMAEEGWFNPAIVQRRWQDHLAGRRDATPALWAVLMFQAWMREQKGRMALAA
ncbi:asparagine synthase (glutamine-hydrolyzing) [Sphingomonas sp. NSE70-1]|uniref:asparagine synthase (glutamine-hydrolyzing) n=1 Tax=Sphingomonas caseinilyticus TaxID=2908205 RepID=A0ABT0RQU0_9SPHN|nr:asparagine synthase (glutamine-hydrolyzing) [Sphingomonas caseinilyticus]MCL6697369.1 asparagine synthase (glutamine-hydrolyzing) [Sphingomonas caseinilyticus]